jgi:hypothetical protein
MVLLQPQLRASICEEGFHGCMMFYNREAMAFILMAPQRLCVLLVPCAQASVAEKAADAAVQALKELPLESKYRAFYTQRICGKIQQEALGGEEAKECS